MLLGSVKNIKKTFQTSVAICALIFSDPSISNAVGPGYGPGQPAANVNAELQENGDVDAINRNGSAVRLKRCGPNSNCVSSSYGEPPNRYVSPLKIVNDRDVSFQRAVRDLKLRQQNNPSMSTIVEIIPREYYIHLTVPGTAPNSLDDIEITFPDDSEIVAVRCEARVTLPPPPFCIKKNCINGNMDQRSRIENVASVLGLPSTDEKQMQGAKWTPIFFNSDRVPGFDDSDTVEW